MFYLPDISASGCKHFGGQQPLRPTESLHFQYGRSSWIWCPWAKKPFSSWLCRGPNCFQPILKYCRLFKIPSSLRGHGQISYCINWYVPVRRIFKGLPPMSLNMDSSPLTVLIRKRSGLWVKEALLNSFTLRQVSTQCLPSLKTRSSIELREIDQKYRIISFVLIPTTNRGYDFWIG